MIKISRRLFSVLLAGVTVVSCLGLNVLAANEDNVKQYGADLQNGGYVAFGDSLTRGLGATADNHDEYKSVESHRRVENSYPTLLADAVKCTAPDSLTAESNFWPICSPGQSLSFTMDLLGVEDGYQDDFYDYGRNGSCSYWFDGVMKRLYGDGKTAAYVNQADLITVNLGLVDVILRPVEIALYNNNNEFTSEMVEEAVRGIKDGYEYWKNAYPLFIRSLKEMNKDATIVLVGFYNAGGDMPLSDEITAPVGMTIGAATGRMNSYVRQLAEETGCIYCDISNAETYAAQYDIGLLSGDFLENWRLYSHLSPEGNNYVYRQIISVLPAEDEQPVEVTTDITVDLGRFKSVNYVMLNGVTLPKSAYSMQGYTLIIPNKSKLCVNLTVAVVGDNRKVSVYTYQLAYHSDTGYEAYLIRGADDVVKTARTAVNSLFTGGISLTKTVIGLLKR